MLTTRRVLVAALLAAVALGLVWAPPAPAVSAGELQQKLREARAKIAAAEKRKASLDDQIADLDGKLTAIEDKLSSLGTQIAGVTERLSATREKLDVLREELRLKRRELERAQAKLKREQKRFEARVVLSYKADDLTYLDVVLASESFDDLVTRVNLVRDLLSGNKDFVAEIEAARDVVRREKQAIAKREGAVAAAVAELQQKSAELVTLRAAQAASQAQAVTMRKSKTRALAGVKGDLAALERQENQLLAESAALARYIAGSSGGGGGTGELMWPVQGPITSPYGYRIHPILGYKKLHTGIDFGVGYGTPIHASDSGTVIYATWMGGYGNVVVVDHGRGISTLYAHQSRMAVGSGARVARGQTIGYVGSTGFSTGPHLHFEVRVNGNPVDPMGYL